MKQLIRQTRVVVLKQRNQGEDIIKRVQILPNLITTFGLACGLFVIFRTAMLETGTINYPVMQASAFLLLLAAAFDVMDGAIARLMQAESEFGVIFDSLADAITFGVAPAVMMLKSLDLSAENHLGLLASIAGMLYAVCGVLRLARYSSTKETSPPADLSERMARFRIFRGLPIPAAAAASVSATLFMISPEVQRLVTISSDVRSIVSICVMILLGYFMLSRWTFPGIRALQLRIQSIYLLLLTAALAIVLFYGFLYYFPVVFVVISWSYLLAAWIWALRRAIRGRHRH